MTYIDEQAAARAAYLKAQGDKPATLRADGSLFIGDDEFPYPIASDSISAEPWAHHTKLTVGIIVGQVTLEKQNRRHFPVEMSQTEVLVVRPEAEPS